jgi:cytochrome P450
LDHSEFGTPQHDLHKMRRAALSPYFSMASVMRLQPVIQERVDLLERLKGFRDSGEVLMASWAFATFTNGE